MELVLAYVPKGRVADVMGQASGLDDLSIESSRRIGRGVAGRALQALRDSAPDLSDLQRVGQSRMEQLNLASSDDLRDAAQAPKCRRVEDSIAVSFGMRPRVGRGLTI